MSSSRGVKAKASSEGNRKIHPVSLVAAAIISGDSGKDGSRTVLFGYFPEFRFCVVKMDLARFIWLLPGVSILRCLRQWCSMLMLFWIVARQRQLVVSSPMQILVDAVTQKDFLILTLKKTLWTDHGSVLPMVTGAGLSQESSW